MTQHAVYSPSAAARFIACPASHKKEMDYPDSPNEYSIQGTHDHTLLEKCLSSELPNAQVMIGRILSDEDGDFTVTAEQAHRVNVVLDYVEQRVDQFKNVEAYSEIRCDLQSYFNEPDYYEVWGTADILLIGNDLMEVIDYKSGFTPVPPDSPQLKIYALGALMAFTNIVHKTDDIVLTIVQPQNSLQNLPVIRSHTFRRDELFEFLVDTLLPALRLTKDPSAPFHSGDHCKYCKHGSNCKERAKENLNRCNILFDKESVIEQTNTLDAMRLSDEQLLDIFEATPMLRSFLKDVEELMLKRWQLNKPVPGTKAVKGKGSREWNQSDEEIEKVLKGMGVPKHTIYPSKLVSPAQATKLTWVKKNSDEVNALSPRQLRKLKDNYITYHTGKPIIVLESDEREGIPTTADLFPDESLGQEVKPEAESEATILPDVNWLLKK